MRFFFFCSGNKGGPVKPLGNGSGYIKNNSYATLMIVNREIEYIKFGEVQYNEETGEIRERFGIGEVERRNKRTITVRLVLPFKSWRKTYPVGAGFRIPHRMCEPAFRVTCQTCWIADYYTQSDLDNEVECDCEGSL